MKHLSRRNLLRLAGALPCALTGAGTAPPLWEEVDLAKAGIRWTHTNALSEKRYMPEAIGPGCAFLDFDGDGLMDLYLVNSGPTEFFTPPRPLRNALYKNNGDGTFTDVTEQAGVAGGSFGMGVAVADYDNDGRPDILVTAYGGPLLYHNNGDGTFTDVTKKAGLDRISSRWTTSAVWFDYDNDGKLDLFLCSYVEYGNGNYFTCADSKRGRNYYCVPRVFKPTASVLLHNNGDGTFTDTGKGTDIGKSLGKALGVVATDVNNDRLMDLWVANDTTQNFLFMNRGKGKWEEIALAAEVAYSDNGQARSGMGVDAADLDQDGWEDLFVTNIDQEMYSLYRNKHDETFTDLAHKHGVAQATRAMSGWGVKFLDFDNDGSLDLLIANGHPDDMIEDYTQNVKYQEPLLLFRNEGGTLRNVSAEAGPVFRKALSARGLAVGDWNNDGRLDALVAVNGGAPVLLKNNTRAGNWAGLQLEGTTCNRDAIGTRISWTAGGKRRTRLKNSGGGFLSSHDPREILGVGEATVIDLIEIQWAAPSKAVTRLEKVPVGRYIRVVEGK